MEKFNRTTDLALIKDALVPKDAWCESAETLFSTYQNDGYGAVIDSFTQSIETDTETTLANIHSVLYHLTYQTDTEINNQLLNLVIDYDLLGNGIGEGRTLQLWRRIKNAPTISDTTKERMFSSIRGLMPRTEVYNDLFYVNELSKLVKVK